MITTSDGVFLASVASFALIISFPYVRRLSLKSESHESTTISTRQIHKIIVLFMSIIFLWFLIPWILFYSDRGTYLQYMDKFLINITLIILGMFISVEVSKRIGR